jgi:hypothetical protein
MARVTRVDEIGPAYTLGREGEGLHCMIERYFEANHILGAIMVLKRHNACIGCCLLCYLQKDLEGASLSRDADLHCMDYDVVPFQSFL